MALNSNKIGGANSKNRIEQPPIDSGMYPARIAQVIDIGLQAQRPYQGKEKPPANEIMLTYELVDTFCVDENGKEQEDKPRWISELIPLHNINQDKAKSTQRYLAADPQNINNGDFSKIVNCPVNVSAVQNKVGDKIYINVAAISAMRAKDAEKCPELKNPAKVFDLDAPDMEIFGSLPEWVQEKIKSNLNFKGSLFERVLNGEAIPAGVDAEGVDDVPWDD